MLIAQEENVVRLLRQMKDQGFTDFVVLDGNLNIFGENVEGKIVHIPKTIMSTLCTFLLPHKPPYSISKIIADIEHDYVGPDKGFKWFDCVHKPNKLRFRESKLGEMVFTMNGIVRCNNGDKIIIGENGEQYPCDKEIFKSLYDEV
jgi:hypothetical protein|nr:MAG TPA: PGDYG protein [Caudoviricetes sp.]